MTDNKWLWFDLDGTIADLYSVEGWLDYLVHGSTVPYEIARPLVTMSLFARRVNELQRRGYSIGIISWASKNATLDYVQAIEEAKRKWLKKHLPSVNWNEIIVTEYGQNKRAAVPCGGILFDDEARNREEWQGASVDAVIMMDVLKELLRYHV
jgi:5'(3')-deoxyribonucleotidase